MNDLAFRELNKRVGVWMLKILNCMNSTVYARQKWRTVDGRIKLSRIVQFLVHDTWATVGKRKKNASQECKMFVLQFYLWAKCACMSCSLYRVHDARTYNIFCKYSRNKRGRKSCERKDAKDIQCIVRISNASLATGACRAAHTLNASQLFKRK